MLFHAESTTTVLAALHSTDQGISHTEAEQRLRQYGPNTLLAAPRPHGLLRFLRQFHNPLIYALLVSAIITFWLQHFADASVIFGVVMVNAIIGFVQEGKAEQALHALHQLLARRAMVLREGARHEIDAAELVPGDIVLLESGAHVPADLRLLSVHELRIQEAILTGESTAAEKNSLLQAQATALADRNNMAYAGCTVAFGHARGVVVATGSMTEIGRIGAMISGMESLDTPLTRKLSGFAKRFTLLILALGLPTFFFAFAYHAMPALDAFLAVVAMFVAIIPEGLPAIVTIALAISAKLMARQKAIVRRLPAVEALGSVNVICTDKTGTLTRNEMTAVRALLPQHTLDITGVGYAPVGEFLQHGKHWRPAHDWSLRQLARCALLCNDAQLHQNQEGEWQLAGDPTEGALLSFACKTGLNVSDETTQAPRIDEIPFESEHRFMATLHHDHTGHCFMLLKGAPERVLDLCIEDSMGQTIDHAAWQSRITQSAKAGQRLLALAQCTMPEHTHSLSQSDIKPRFTLLGMLAMTDPARPDAITAIAVCRRAGIRVLMITGDHVETAAAIGQQLGLQTGTPLCGDAMQHMDDQALQKHLLQTDIVARASPEHKLRLVSILQQQGLLVAMTGDGVNDAPALKAADIGVAMGLRGTDAAKQAADLVLTDDNFSTIAQAVREGRTVFDNIKKSMLFIMPTNGGEAGVILLAVILGLALPVTTAQILWVNMVTTITLALALAFEKAEADIMHQPPRPPGAPLISRLMLGRIVYVALLMIAATFLVFEWELSRGNSLDLARTAALNMLVMGEMVYLFNVRHFIASSLRPHTLLGNPVAFGAAVILFGLQLLLTYTPIFQVYFHTASLDWASWGMILGLGIVKFIAVEGEKWLLRRFGILRI